MSPNETCAGLRTGIITSQTRWSLAEDSIRRIGKTEGLNRRPSPASTHPAQGPGTVKHHGLGFVPIDIKPLPKLRTANGEPRQRFLSVATDRRSRAVHRAVHRAVKDDNTGRSAMAFLREPDN